MGNLITVKREYVTVADNADFFCFSQCDSFLSNGIEQADPILME